MALVGALVLLVGGCGMSVAGGDPPNRASVLQAPSVSGIPTRSESGGPAAPGWTVVALGDSVTSGGPCGCTPFPQRYGRDLSMARGAHTVTRNLGVSGETSGQLLAALHDPGSVETRAVRGADIVLLTIGANDFQDRHDEVTSGRCLGDRDADCVADDLDSMVSNVEAILSTIHQLRSGHRTAILVTGYWNVFEDGAVARQAFPRVGVQATQRLTGLVNAGMRKAADDKGATYVDLWDPFNGPVGGGDTTNLLASDGDHPNARGQEVIARRLLAAGLPGLVAG